MTVTRDTAPIVTVTRDTALYSDNTILDILSKHNTLLLFKIFLEINHRDRNYTGILGTVFVLDDVSGLDEKSVSALISIL